MPDKKDYYRLRMQQIPSKLGLSQQCQVLLNSYDEYERSIIDGSTLGRQIRLSPAKRTAITDAISKCANYMKKHTEYFDDCLAIIQTCTQLLSIADSGLAQTSVFPFRKLPLEIREKVFGKVIGNVRWPIHRKNRVAIVGFCSCPKPTSSPWEATKLNLHLARTSKEMYSEMMAYLFKSTTINFNCSCEMVKTIGEHKVLQENVRSIQYHWVGPTSDKAFLKLAGCPNLRSLELIVSRSTLRWIDEDEMEMAKYFGPRQSLRVTESLGFSELIRIRGLLNVRVGHTGAKTADKIQESQRSGLESLLRDRLRQ